MTMLIMAVALAGGWWAWPHLRRRQARRHRSLALADEVADTADLLLVVLGAGGTVASAVEVLAARGQPFVRAAFAEVLRRSSGGEPLSVALIAAADALGAPFEPLVSALIAADRDGAPLGSLLLRLGGEGRRARRQRLDREAREVPVQLLFPLVLCSLPAVVVVAVVPLVLVAVGSIGP